MGGDSHLVSIAAKAKTVHQWRHEIDDLALADETAKGGAAAVMRIEGEDEDAAVFDVEELMRQLVALEASILPAEEAVTSKNR